MPRRSAPRFANLTRRLELIRCRGGEAQNFEVEACDANGRLALPTAHGSLKGQSGSVDAGIRPGQLSRRSTMPRQQNPPAALYDSKEA